MAETKKKVVTSKKKDTKKAVKKTEVKKEDKKKVTPKKVVKKEEPKKEEIKVETESKAEKETMKLTNEAVFSVWVDIFILILIVLMFAVILYGYIIAK